MKITIHSPKFGTHDVLMDEDDHKQLSDWVFYLWSTPRHHGVYVNCYSPDNKRAPKRLHRVIVGAVSGQIVDHINGNPLDNRRCNLRIVNHFVNNQNARKRKDGLTSMFKGVCSYGKRWRAQIQINKKKMSLGIFDLEIEAARAFYAALDKHGLAGPRNLK